MALFPADNWVAANGKAPDGPVFVRIRSDDPDPAEKANFANLVIVKWPFDAAANEGVPSLAELDMMNQLEERLLAAFTEETPAGCGVAVFTIPGSREWRFYTPDAQEFIQTFNSALEGLPAFPIGIEAFQDPEWSAFEEIKPRAEDE